MVQVSWFQGYFTGRVHAAIVQRRRAMVFHNEPILWSLCGVPVAASELAAGIEHCAKCETRALALTTAQAREPEQAAS